MLIIESNKLRSSLLHICLPLRYKLIWLLGLFFFTFVNSSLAQQGRPNFDPSGGFGQGGSFGFDGPNSSFSDTTERPPLSVALHPIYDLSNPDEGLDTLQKSLHLVEPAYRYKHLSPNLGSPNSAAQWAPWILQEDGLGFGHDQYQKVVEDVSEPYLVEVNRAYGDIAIAEGYNQTPPTIGGRGFGRATRHFSTRFYRSFARNIGLNFNYKSFTDNGFYESQSNSVRYLDLKFFQSSKSKNRTSFIQFDNPRVEELINRDVLTPGSSDILTTSWSSSNIILGNRIMSHDTTGITDQWIWDSRLSYNIRSFDALGNNISSANSTFIPSAIILGDTVDYQHRANILSLDNEFSLKLLDGELKAGLLIQSISETFGDSILSAGHIALLSDIIYQRRVGDLSFWGKATLGLADASRRSGLQAGLAWPISTNLHFEGALAAETFAPSLAHQTMFIGSREVMNNTLGEISQLKIGGTLNYVPSGTNVSLELKTLDGLVTLDTRGLIINSAERITLISLAADQEVKIGPFYTAHHVLLQNTSDNQISLPALSYRGDVHIRGSIFRKNMFVHLGADLHFLTSYDTPEYLALTGLFYNSDFTPNSPLFFIQPYLNAKVKQFQIFVKGVNLAHQLRSTNNQITLSTGVPRGVRDYPLVTGAPIYDFRIHFGIKWYFLD